MPRAFYELLGIFGSYFEHIFHIPEEHTLEYRIIQEWGIQHPL